MNSAMPGMRSLAKINGRLLATWIPWFELGQSLLLPFHTRPSAEKQAMRWGDGMHMDARLRIRLDLWVDIQADAEIHNDAEMD